jgi:hypothetical protein
MVSPLRNSPDLLQAETDHPRLSCTPDRPQEIAESRPDAAAGADDLRRLESSIAWIMRESMMARLEATPRASKRNRKFPRAGVLPPVSGVPPVDVEGSRRKRETSTPLLPPSLASERVQLQLPRTRHHRSLRGALCLLIASMIAGSIAYHVSAKALLTAREPAQAASLQAR